MVDFTTIPAAPTQFEYLESAAATVLGRGYKQRFLDALDVRSGQSVLDVGSGTGTDLGRLADIVGPRGSVVGIDHDPAMVERARHRFAGRPTIDVRVGDAHDLPLDSASVDRARVDRVLQHVTDPGRAVSELRRVLRPGGVLGLAEPDWDTLVVDDSDVDTSRAFTRFTASQVRNSAIGRQLARLAAEARFTVDTVDASVMVFREFEAAEQILGLRRNTVRAVQAGALDQTAANNWLDRLTAGPFLACFTFFTVTAGV